MRHQGGFPLSADEREDHDRWRPGHDHDRHRRNSGLGRPGDIGEDPPAGYRRARRWEADADAAPLESGRITVRRIARVFVVAATLLGSSPSLADELVVNEIKAFGARMDTAAQRCDVDA